MAYILSTHVHHNTLSVWASAIELNRNEPNWTERLSEWNGTELTSAQLSKAQQNESACGCVNSEHLVETATTRSSILTFNM